MADPLLKLKDQITCPVCLDIYENPKSLVCQHALCMKCLDDLPVDIDDGKHVIKCPECRELTMLPEDGSTADLPPAFQINTTKDAYIEASNLLAASMKDDRVPVQDATTAGSTVPEETTVYQKCPIHNRDMEMFCEKCHKVLCAVCGLREHGNHRCDLVAALYPKHQETIQAHFTRLKHKIKAVLNALNALATMKEEIVQQGECTNNDIDSHVQKIVEAVRQSGEKLKENVNEIVEQKKSFLSAQRERIEKLLDPLKSCESYIAQTLSKKVQYQILQEETQMITRMKAVCDSVSIGNPPSKEGVVLIPNQDIIEQCRNIGSVSSVLLSKIIPTRNKEVASSENTATAAVTQCTCTGKGSVVGMVGKKASFDLHTSLDGSLHCYLHNPKCNSVIRCDVSECTMLQTERVTSKKSNFKSFSKAKHSPKLTHKYTLSYTPTQEGVHSIVVEIDGVNVSSSPSTIEMLPSPRMREKKMKEIGEGLNGPAGIAITNDDVLVVSEWNSRSIALCDNNGYLIIRYNQLQLLGQLLHVFQPKGIAVTPDDHVIVADSTGNYVQKFTMDGMHVSSVGGTGKEQLEFMAPSDVAVDNRGYVYISDTENQRIQVLKPNLSFSSTIGSFGNGMGHFVHPTGIAIDSQNRLYVCDSLNSRIQKFSSQGDFVAEFGRDVLGEPQHIAIGPYNMIYVSDSETNQVAVFDSDGEYMGCIMVEGMEPLGLAVDSKGNLYICSHDKILLL